MQEMGKFRGKIKDKQSPFLVLRTKRSEKDTCWEDQPCTHRPKSMLQPLSRFDSALFFCSNEIELYEWKLKFAFFFPAKVLANPEQHRGGAQLDHHLSHADQPRLTLLRQQQTLICRTLKLVPGASSRFGGGISPAKNNDDEFTIRKNFIKCLKKIHYTCSPSL